MNYAQTIANSSAFSPIDREFARFCARHVQATDAPLITALAALVSRARAQGDSCLALDQWANQPLPSEGRVNLAKSIALPELETCIHILKSQVLVGDGSTPTPLVLDQTRLYLYRYWHAEKVLSEFIKTRGEVNPSNHFSRDFIQTFHTLFGPFQTQPDWQAVAAFAASRSQFTLITGGPGTGKTTTVVRLLALLLQEQTHLRIAVTAPTGKAVARLMDSLSVQIRTLPLALAERIPKQVRTLHRLLGYQPKHDRFQFNASRQLAYDLILVDEASMVDILLMAALVKAIPPHARLILLGDHQQLASVDAGNILADLCQVANPKSAHSQRFTEAYQSLTGQALPTDQQPTPLLRDTVVMLRHSHRFDDFAGLGALSRAIRTGQKADAIRLLQDPNEPDVVRLDTPTSTTALLKHLDGFLTAFFAAPDLKTAFRIFAQLQLMTALREGRWGVTGLNNLIEQSLRRKGHRFLGAHYDRRPLIVTRNDYGQQLFNGDIGLCWQDAAQTLRAFFPSQEQEFRSIPLLKLPPVESAWALTVHKSQGSEFEEVLFLLPPSEHPLCTRELLYTGMTRARKKATLFGTIDQIGHAIDQETTRVSGLAQILAQHD